MRARHAGRTQQQRKSLNFGDTEGCSCIYTKAHSGRPHACLLLVKGPFLGGRRTKMCEMVSFSTIEDFPNNSRPSNPPTGPLQKVWHQLAKTHA